MSGRTIAIGDIHGCLAALNTILEAVQPQPGDTLVTLGDQIDRGPDSRGVLERLIELSGQCWLISLRGDHEELLLKALSSKAEMKRWLSFGGSETLRSYGWTPGTLRRSLADWIPPEHQEFLAQCPLYYETPTHLFVHAGVQPELSIEQQPPDALLWRVTDPKTVIPHCSGKILVVGHTPQLSGEVRNLGFLICIDTHCVRGGWLTALHVETGQIWQADCHGRLRQN